MIFIHIEAHCFVFFHAYFLNQTSLKPAQLCFRLQSTFDVYRWIRMKQYIWCHPMQMQHFKHHRGSSEALHQSRHCEIMWEDITEETNSLKVTSHNRIKHRRTLFCVSGNVKFSFFVWRCFSLKFQPPDCHGWGEQRWILCFALKWN